MRAMFAAATALALSAGMSACTTMADPAAPASPAPAARAYTAQEEEILKVVDRMLLAIGNHDAAELDRLLITEGVSYMQRIKPGGENKVTPLHNEDLMTPKPDADPFIERYWDPVVQIRGSLAQVWAPYELRDNGKQIHCGIDGFDLVHLDGDWRVASILSTMEPQGCEGFLPASPASMRPRDGWKETPNQ